MRNIAQLALMVLCLSGTVAEAETLFAVTNEDIEICSELGDLNKALAVYRDAGASREQVAALISTDVRASVRADLLNILFAFEPGDPGLVAKATGAICVLERLNPIERN